MRRYRTTFLAAVAAFAAGWLLAPGRTRERPSGPPHAVSVPASVGDQVTLFQCTDTSVSPPHSTMFVLTPHTVRHGDRTTHLRKPPPDAKLWTVHFGDVWLFCEQTTAVPASR